VADELKPVRVSWLDSMTLDEGGWLDVGDVTDEDALTASGIRHESVGYLVAESDDVVAIAGARNDGDGPNHNTRVAGVILIPRCAIIDGPKPLR
jgi:hypothetical protein